MKNKGGRDAGKCSKMVLDHADRCLFVFNFVVLFFKHIYVSVY
jgi:hypothetical protein